MFRGAGGLFPAPAFISFSKFILFFLAVVPVLDRAQVAHNAAENLARRAFGFCLGRFKLCYFSGYFCFFHFLFYSLQALFLGSHKQAIPVTLPQLLALSSVMAGSAKSQGGKHTAALLLGEEAAHPLITLIIRHSSTAFIAVFISLTLLYLLL